MESAKAFWKRDWFFALALALATLAAYQPAWNGKPIWDDDAHLTKPALRSVRGLVRIWIEPGATQQYYPLVHSAFWLEQKIWDESPLGYHLVNILLHVLAAILFLRILRILGIPGARLAAAIFALHPVMVESVAWITELKNTLSGVFYLGAALFYLRFDRTRRAAESLATAIPIGAAAPGGSRSPMPVRLAPMPPEIREADSLMPPRASHETSRPDPDPSGHQRSAAQPTAGACWNAALLLFLLGLASKTVVATLPAALLVLFWWERGTLSWKRDVAPLLPFFGAGIGAGLFTVWMERHFIGANGAAFNFSLIERFLIAGRAIWFYLGKLFWPENLMFIYPRWNVTHTAAWQYLYPAAGFLLLAVLWLFRRRSRGPLAALLFFAATLFPALGFFNVFPFVYSFVADHFQYLASLGIIALVCAGAVVLWDRRHWPAGGLLSVAIPVVLGCLTWRQCAMYANMESLWRTTIKQNPGCAMAYNNLGFFLLHDGRSDEAFTDFQKALSLDPYDTQAHFNLGNAFLQKARLDEAIAEYQIALNEQPGFASAHINLGTALLRMKREGEAIAQFQLALKTEPDSTVAHYNLANILLREGRDDEAILQYQKALQTKPDMTEASIDLSAAFLQKGNTAQAIEALERALKLAEAEGNAQMVRSIETRIDFCRKPVH